MNTVLVVILVLFLVILFEILRTVLNPLTGSDEKIKDKLLLQFPIGTQMEDIIQYANKEKEWLVRYKNRSIKWLLQEYSSWGNCRRKTYDCSYWTL